MTVLCLAAAAVMLAGAAPGSAKRDDPNKDSRTILVKFVPGVDAKGSVNDEGDKDAGELKTKVHVIKVKGDSSVDDAIARYSARPDVEYAEANYVATADALSAPSDPSYGSQWALAQIHAFDGWSTYPGAYGTTDGTVIAVADTGIDSTHPDLVSQVDTADGANCLSGTCSSDTALDDNGHGTHVAGIAAASTDNGVGIAGESYASSVMPVKVLDSSGSGTYSAIASGIIWAADHGAEVINLSLSGAAYSKTLCDAVSYATSHGSVVVAAAGNDSSSIQEYPAACPGAIGVGATDSSDALASFSDYGYPDVFVTAPGVSILSTYSGGGYATLSGTSMAAPYVSGLAALLRGENPARTVADVKEIIASTADKVGGSAYGGDRFRRLWRELQLEQLVRLRPGQRGKRAGLRADARLRALLVVAVGDGPPGHERLVPGVGRRARRLQRRRLPTRRASLSLSPRPISPSRFHRSRPASRVASRSL